jgi:hypothetical protein
MKLYYPDDAELISKYFTEYLLVLLSESPYSYYDDRFYQWLRDEWSINVIMDNTVVAGIEIAEETATFLVLKFA